MAPPGTAGALRGARRAGGRGCRRRLRPLAGASAAGRPGSGRDGRVDRRHLSGVRSRARDAQYGRFRRLRGRASYSLIRAAAVARAAIGGKRTHNVEDDQAVSDADKITIDRLSAATDDARALVGELDLTLAAEYSPE